MTVTKKHKMYVKLGNNSTLNNLAKLSPSLYVYIFNHFTKNGGNKEYLELNKDVKSWKQYQPIRIILNQEQSAVVKKANQTKIINCLLQQLMATISKIDN